jgi:hypothetical protein
VDGALTRYHVADVSRITQRVGKWGAGKTAVELEARSGIEPLYAALQAAA